jgi:hypothetical protein
MWGLTIQNRQNQAKSQLIGFRKSLPRGIPSERVRYLPIRSLHASELTANGS